jgi:hypothetical protein
LADQPGSTSTVLPFTSPHAQAPDHTPLPDLVDSVLTVPSFNLFAGASGAGKSSFICRMLGWLLREEPIFGHTTKRPPAVAWVSMDRPWHDTQRLFDLYSVPRDIVPIYGWSRIDHPHFLPVAELWKASSVPGNLAPVFARIVDQFALPEGSLVIVDPGPTLIGADQNHYVRMALGMMALYDIINQKGRKYCVIATDHPAKQQVDSRSGYRRIEDRIGGSAGKGAHANTLMYLAEPKEIRDDQRTHLFYWKPRRAAAAQFCLLRDPITGLLDTTDPNHQVAEVLAPLKDEPELQSVLDSIPATSETITWPALIQLFGDRGKRTLERQLKALIDRNYVRRLEKGVYTRIVALTTPPL